MVTFGREEAIANSWPDIIENIPPIDVGFSDLKTIFGIIS